MENEFTGFNCFMEESSEVGKAYIDMILQQEKASALDNKTRELAYIAVLAATGIMGGLLYHVQSAKKLGASRDEVKSAILVPADSPAQIISLCPMLLDDGTQTLPLSFAGVIFNVVMRSPIQYRQVYPASLFYAGVRRLFFQ